METVHPLETWRLDKGLSRRQLGEKIGCQAMTIHRYERGRKGGAPQMPSKSHLEKIVVVTGGEVDANAWLEGEAGNVVAQRRAAA